MCSNVYEQSLEDVLMLQGEMARDIAGEIQVKLTEPEKIRLTNPPSISQAACQDYRTGHY